VTLPATESSTSQVAPLLHVAVALFPAAMSPAQVAPAQVRLVLLPSYAYMLHTEASWQVSSQP
jgi:hypothetical protein